MNKFVLRLLPFIVKTPVFRTLAKLQRTLDPLDIEGLFSLHQAHQSRQSIPPLESSFPDPTIDDWETFVNTYIDSESQSTLDHNIPDPGRLHYYAMAYLLSASFKDCSVIMRPGGSGSRPGTATVIDLDPKSFDRMKKWAELDREIALAFYDDGERRCTDSI